ncbi:MAG: DUF983 domain-containing protein [Actinobacteria bacterium]|nr:DUF983 domain-containing protein [Actinomycetota bacterium]MCB9389097.1 DUF983 domain-containing protein [Acidimicrobiia bacterium]
MQQTETAAPSFHEASKTTKLSRGVIRQCPACGSGKLFRRWFVMVDRCPQCDLKFEREPGHWSGALGINTIMSFGVLLITIIVSVIATYPDLPVGRLVAICLVVAICMPVFYYPLSKVQWTAIDTCMNPLRPGEVKQPWGPPPAHDDQGSKAP